MDIVTIDGRLKVGPGQPFLFIGGPCALESEALAGEVATELLQVCSRLGISYVFKASFDKANRTSLDSFRGPGLKKGLEILSRIKKLGVPVVSDIHETTKINPFIVDEILSFASSQF